MMTLEEKLQAYDNFYYRTIEEIELARKQNQLRDKAITRVLNKLNQNPSNKEKLLKILSGLLINKYLESVYMEDSKIDLTNNEISRKVTLGEISEAKAIKLRKKRTDCFQVEYQVCLYRLIGIPNNQEMYDKGLSMESYLKYVKMKRKSIKHGV